MLSIKGFSKIFVETFWKVILILISFLICSGRRVFAMAGASGGRSNMSSFIMIAVIFFIFYFLLIRPQRKKQKEHQKMLDNLKKDDKVLTAGGIYGLVVGIHEDTVVLKLADNIKVEFSRGAISKVIK